MNEEPQTPKELPVIGGPATIVRAIEEAEIVRMADPDDLNDDGEVIGRAKPMTDEERTTAYDTFVVLSGLMAGMSEQAKTTNDKALQKSVREMALTTLKKFDLTLPAKRKK
jgi:CxxC motif-containing protein (DUF1111 family)